MRLSAALAFLKCSSAVANIEAVRRKNIFLNCQQNAITSHKDVYIGKKRTSGSIWECWILDLTKIFHNTIKIVSEKKIKIGIYPFKHVYFKNRKVPRKKTLLLANLGLFMWAKVKLFDMKRINRKLMYLEAVKTFCPSSWFLFYFFSLSV